MNALELKNFELGYITATGIRPIVEDVNLSVPCGQLLLLVGPSGGGKSSLLAAILGLEDPYHPHVHRKGQLRVLGETMNGELPRSLRGRVSAVFQGGALIDELTPRANVRLATLESGYPRGQEMKFLARVGLPHPPSSVAALSGGEQKRVALARALADEPELWILDEPSAGLDDASANDIARLIRDLHDNAENRTTIVITHDLDAFASTADGVLLLDRTRGTLELHSPDQWRDALSSAQRRATRTTGPAPWIPRSLTSRLGTTVSHLLLALAAVLRTAALTVRHPIPRHFGMLGRAFNDHLLAPAPFIALASFAGGAIATWFALRNNPLDGAFQRQILTGSGKVMVSTALPLLAGLLFAARISAGATARISNLRRTRVIEALPLLGISPHAFLFNPLLLSSLVAAIVMTALALVSGCLAGLVAAGQAVDLTPTAWAAATFDAVTPTDLRWVMAKALVTGIVTALTSYHLASQPMGSSRDVANAANGAIVWSTLMVLVIHSAITVYQFG